MVTLFHFEVISSGLPLGSYRGRTAADALDACYRAAGYASAADGARQLGLTLDELRRDISAIPGSDREHYRSLFAFERHAIEFECSALAIGREFLPAFAAAVLDGDEPSDVYWAWLTEQAEGAR